MTSTNTTRAAIYLRISKDRTGEELGVTRQREDCLRECERRGWTPVEYCDNDISASSFSKKPRPEYERMIADIEEGKIQAVVAYKTDRLHRRPAEAEAFINLANLKHVDLVTVTGQFDLSTSEGRMAYRNVGTYAAYESDVKSDRQRRAARQVAERGLPKWPQMPFGYRRAGDVVEVDRVRAELVRDAYAAILSGTTVSDIARMFNKAGQHGVKGKPWTASTMSLFLRAPRNAGLRSHNDEIVGKGQWPALVDEDTWRRVQTILNDDKRKPGKKAVRRHLLTGVLVCGKCGGRLAGGSQTAQNTRVYSCKSCRGVSIRADAVEPLMFKIVAGRLAMEDAVDLLKSQKHDAAEAERIRREKETLYARRQQLAVDYARGVLDGDQVQIATATINSDIAELERQEQDDEKLRVFDGVPLGKPEVREAVDKLTHDRFRRVVDLLMTVTIKPVGKGGYQVINPHTGAKGIKEDRVQVEWK
ncbi:recombinase family protein [Mycobacterium conspicuum]|uniref:Serine recombinase n=1 Tax=Mycobacterium conspicuum TaxID=44010 RepID=A0A1X1T2Y5_9MYCO|nr:recombinase family protein [Mycobacterium conspicuum]ORV38738.1 serine recombinase [Mycobacterium conspicuum]BBZ41148.1 serine recombinase [Mycobacterium conspicuum]